MKEKPVTLSRRKYDASFKEEVLQMVFNGRPVSEMSRSPGIGQNTSAAGKVATKPEKTKGKRLLLPHRFTRPCTSASGGWRPREHPKKALAIFSRQT